MSAEPDYTSGIPLYTCVLLSSPHTAAASRSSASLVRSTSWWGAAERGGGGELSPGACLTYVSCRYVCDAIDTRSDTDLGRLVVK